MHGFRFKGVNYSAHRQLRAVAEACTLEVGKCYLWSRRLKEIYNPSYEANASDMVRTPRQQSRIVTGRVMFDIADDLLRISLRRGARRRPRRKTKLPVPRSCRNVGILLDVIGIGDSPTGIPGATN